MSRRLRIRQALLPLHRRAPSRQHARSDRAVVQHLLLRARLADDQHRSPRRDRPRLRLRHQDRHRREPRGARPHADSRLVHAALQGPFRGGFTLLSAIGQGATTVTVLQLALAYAALANGGTLYQPQVVRSIETSDGTVVQEFPPRVRRMVDVDAGEPQLVKRRARRRGHRRGRHGLQGARRGRRHGRQDRHRAGDATSRRAAPIPSKVWYFNRDHAWFAGYAPSQLARDRRRRARRARRRRRQERRAGGHARGARLAEAQGEAPHRADAGDGAQPGGATSDGARSPISFRGRARGSTWPLFMVAVVIVTLGVVNLYSATSVYVQPRARAWRHLLSARSTGWSSAASRRSWSPPSTTGTSSASATFLYVGGLLSLGLVFVLGARHPRLVALDRDRVASPSSRASS